MKMKWDQMHTDILIQLDTIYQINVNLMRILQSFSDFRLLYVKEKIHGPLIMHIQLYYGEQ